MSIIVNLQNMELGFILTTCIHNSHTYQINFNLELGGLKLIKWMAQTKLEKLYMIVFWEHKKHKKIHQFWPSQRILGVNYMHVASSY